MANKLWDNVETSVYLPNNAEKEIVTVLRVQGNKWETPCPVGKFNDLPDPHKNRYIRDTEDLTAPYSSITMLLEFTGAFKYDPHHDGEFVATCRIISYNIDWGNVAVHSFPGKVWVKKAD